MGYKRSPFKDNQTEDSVSRKRTYMRQPNQGEFELERDTGWNDRYTGNSAIAEATHDCHTNGSEERLRDLEPHRNENGGIWKSTSMVVSRGEV